MAVRPGDYCKRCGIISDPDDALTHLVGYRGWCLSCEDEDEARIRSEQRAAQEAKEAFLALPDEEKWERLYDAVFEGGSDA